MLNLRKVFLLNRVAFQIFVCLILISCSSTSHSKKIGDIGFTTKQCLAADTKDNFDKMTEISSRLDQPALMQMVTSGQVVIIPGKTLGTVRDVSFGVYQFEYNNGIDNVRMWVSAEFIE